MPRKCSICEDERAQQWATDLYLGKITLEDISRDSGMSYQMVWRHFHEHVEVSVQNGQIVLKQIKPEENYIEVLHNLMDDLRRMVKDLQDEPTNQATVKMKTQLISEIRGLIRDLCTLEGTLRRGPLIQLNQLNIQFEYLTSYLAMNLCEHCKKKVAEFLVQERKVPVRTEASASQSNSTSGS